MKIANVQVYEVCDRSEFVEISDDEIEELKAWKGYPFTGETEAELAAYVAGLGGVMSEDEAPDDTPEVALSLFLSFWGGNMARITMWDSSFNRNESKITVFDDDERELGKADSTMV